MKALFNIFLIISSLMTTSCMASLDNNEDIDTEAYAIIQGKITDMDGNPIEKIKISIRINEEEDAGTCYSSSNGTYRKTLFKTNTTDRLIIELLIEDIDGDEHGGFFESQKLSASIIEDEITQWPVIIDLPCRLNLSTPSENIPQS